MGKLQNKVAVITGGNSGIGLAVAKLFSAEGATVAVTGRSAETLEKAEGIIGHGAKGFVTDVSSPADIQQTYSKISRHTGKFDILVVNAGVGPSAPLTDFTEEQFDETSDINFKGTFFSVQRALPYLNDGASVILTSSATNEKGFPGYAAYAATKAAIRSLARSFSAELLSSKIRVNVISPGAVDTPFYGRGGGSDEQVQAVKDYMAGFMIPAKRIGTADEVARAFLFLASDDSPYIIGADLVIDGGVKTL